MASTSVGMASTSVARRKSGDEGTYSANGCAALADSTVVISIIRRGAGGLRAPGGPCDYFKVRYFWGSNLVSTKNCP